MGRAFRFPTPLTLANGWGSGNQNKYTIDGPTNGVIFKVRQADRLVRVSDRRNGADYMTIGHDPDRGEFALSLESFNTDGEDIFFCDLSGGGTIIEILEQRKP